MLKLYQEAGTMALGSRLRQLGEALGAQAEKVYQMYGVNMEPKWFPVFFLLKDGNCMAITALAEAIGHSHASVSKIVKEMTRAGICSSEKVPGDGRINQVCLTAQGRAELEKFQRQSADVETVVAELLGQSQNNLWEAISEFEYLLDERNFFTRIKEQYQERVQAKLELVEFEEKYTKAFSKLNYDWIEKFFKVEESDRAMLDAPQEYILDKGGYIVMAVYENNPVGTGALIKQVDNKFELAKMAVDDSAKGLGIGYLMGTHLLEVAKKLGGKSVFLESNTKLTPAINLYKKLGFRRIVGEPSPYARCNIQMEVEV
ncbi:MAG: helix-turn-helix domain-containing GNAT family N-acetyltransferase [Gammaproteobacteria bacterium]|nr:helix-turn-helix domain-containing GNAT family N-acetyltransferase [Gammaproteobacteria bacterium]MDD9959300.1 helix-turn-helix domain-containing GNAT family N-acetyltransferase [Gammaproteobacteria bacterium]